MRSRKPNKTKLKIGLVFDDSLDRTDGVSQYIRTLGGWLSAQGHAVTYVVGQTRMKNWRGGKVYSLSRNLKVAFNGNRLTTPMPAKTGAVRKMLIAEDFDLLHVQVPYSPFMAKKVINKAQDRTAVVGTFHILPSGWMAVWGTTLLRFWYGRSLKRIQPMLSVSTSAAEFCHSSLKRACQISPNVVELKRFRLSRKVANRDNKIVFLGRLVERKGCLYLLKAFITVSKLKPEARLVLAGDGPQLQELERFVENNGLADKVSFLGFIDEADKPALLSSAAVACFPATSGESFGIVLIEAMAAGAGVVIGGNNPGYSTVLSDDVLFDPKNTDALSALILKILDDKTLAAKLHSHQQKQVLSYDVDKVGHEVVRIYRQAVAKQRQRSHN